MRILPSLDFESIALTQKALSAFVSMLQKTYRNLAVAFNGNIGFGDGFNSDNISGVWASVSFGMANTDVTITHNLGRIPVGYIVMSKTAACDVYTGSVAPTKTQLTLRGSVGSVSATVFIV